MRKKKERRPMRCMVFSPLSVNPNVRDSATTYMKYNAMMMLRIARVLLCPCDTKHTKMLVVVCCKIQIYHEHTTLQGRHEDKQLGNTRQNQKNSTTVEAASGTPFDNTSCCSSSLISIAGILNNSSYMVCLSYSAPWRKQSSHSPREAQTPKA